MPGHHGLPGEAYFVLMYAQGVDEDQLFLRKAGNGPSCGLSFRRSRGAAPADPYMNMLHVADGYQSWRLSSNTYRRFLSKAPCLWAASSGTVISFVD